MALWRLYYHLVWATKERQLLYRSRLRIYALRVHLGKADAIKSDCSFGWQRGYGVFSLGHKQLTIATNYVKNQKAHHSQGTTITSLEQDSVDDEPPKNENPK